MNDLGETGSPCLTPLSIGISSVCINTFLKHFINTVLTFLIVVNTKTTLISPTVENARACLLVWRCTRSHRYESLTTDVELAAFELCTQKCELEITRMHSERGH